MRRVVICSPWRGDEELHGRYLDACLADSFARGEAPIASHAIGPRVLREEVPAERECGSAASVAWLRRADALAVYHDLGVSEGMAREIGEAQAWGIPIEDRRLGVEWVMRGEPPASVAEISDREVCRSLLHRRPGEGLHGRVSRDTGASLAAASEAIQRVIARGFIAAEGRGYQLTDAGRRLLDGEEPSCA